MNPLIIPLTQGKKVYVGTFDSPVDAAKARDRKAIEIWGEFAFLNFPEQETF